MSSTRKDTKDPVQKPEVDLTHMPQYIKQAPWYIDQKDQPVLNHQRARNDAEKITIHDTWFRRGGVRTDQQVTKFRKGACTNCGALTHNVKTCTDRPRKIGAKYAQRDLANDEIVEQNQQGKLNYEAKRDRWNGYDTSAFKQVVEEWNEVNEEQRKRQAEELKAKLAAKKEDGHDSFESEESDDNDDPDIEKDDLDASRKQANDIDPRTRTITRNLRIREDTAKYLRNLDPNSAAYSGKSRTMNDNPNPDIAAGKSMFKGDNVAKFSGDFIKYLNQEAFTLEAQKAGVEVNHVGMPSQVEIMHKEFRVKKELLKEKKMQELIARYGGEKHLIIPEDVRQANDPTDAEVAAEVAAQRAIEEFVPMMPKQVAQKQSKRELVGVQSKYDEDVYTNGHTSVWGSYWHPDLGWGFKCCYAFDKRASCKGEEGKVESIKREYELEIRKKKEEEDRLRKAIELENQRFKPAKKEARLEEMKEVSVKLEDNPLSGDSSNSEDSSSSDSESDSSSSSSDNSSDRRNRRHAKQSSKRRRRRHSSSSERSESPKKASLDERKRAYNSFAGEKPMSKAELEEYQRKRQHFDDPMRGAI